MKILRQVSQQHVDDSMGPSMHGWEEEDDDFEIDLMNGGAGDEDSVVSIVEEAKSTAKMGWSLSAFDETTLDDSSGNESESQSRAESVRSTKIGKKLKLPKKKGKKNRILEPSNSSGDTTDTCTTASESSKTVKKKKKKAKSRSIGSLDSLIASTPPSRLKKTSQPIRQVGEEAEKGPKKGKAKPLVSAGALADRKKESKRKSERSKSRSPLKGPREEDSSSVVSSSSRKLSKPKRIKSLPVGKISKEDMNESTHSRKSLKSKKLKRRSSGGALADRKKSLREQQAAIQSLLEHETTNGEPPSSGEPKPDSPRMPTLVVSNDTKSEHVAISANEKAEHLDTTDRPRVDERKDHQNEPLQLNKSADKTKPLLVPENEPLQLSQSVDKTKPLLVLAAKMKAPNDIHAGTEPQSEAKKKEDSTASSSKHPLLVEGDNSNHSGQIQAATEEAEGVKEEKQATPPGVSKEPMDTKGSTSFSNIWTGGEDSPDLVTSQRSHSTEHAEGDNAKADIGHSPETNCNPDSEKTVAGFRTISTQEIDTRLAEVENLERNLASERQKLQKERESISFERESLEFQVEEEAQKNDLLTQQVQRLEEKLLEHRAAVSPNENRVDETEFAAENEALQAQLETEKRENAQKIAEKNIEIEGLKKIVSGLKKDESVEEFSVNPNDGKSRQRLQGELLQAAGKLADKESVISRQNMEISAMREELAGLRQGNGVQKLKNEILHIQKEKEGVREELENELQEAEMKLKSKDETIAFLIEELGNMKKEQGSKNGLLGFGSMALRDSSSKDDGFFGTGSMALRDSSSRDDGFFGTGSMALRDNSSKDDDLDSSQHSIGALLGFAGFGSSPGGLRERMKNRRLGGVSIPVPKI